MSSTHRHPVSPTQCLSLILLVVVLLSVLAAPAGAVVTLDPELESQLRAQGALEAVLRQLQRASEEGFFEMAPPEGGLDAAKRATWNALVILVDFDDKPNLGTFPAAIWQDHLFSQGTHSTGSMTDIYLDNSYGNFTITGDVVGWYRMPQPYSYYVNADGVAGTADDYGFGTYPQNAGGLTVAAIQAADPFVDFNDYRNGRATVDGVFIVHAGAGAEQTGSASDIWSHQSSVLRMTDDGVQVRTYTQEPEYRSGGYLTDVGVFAHEFGHVLGLPDLYDTDYSSAGVGRWSMMSGGSWNGGGAHPADFDAWCKIQLGYLTPIELVAEGTDIVLPPAETSDVVYRLHNDAMGQDEYFLLENRQPLGNDAWLPGAGMLFWHIDDARSNNRSETCDPGASLHPIVRLLQADGLCELESGGASDSGDPFPGSTGNPRIDSTGTPNTRSYLDQKTSIALFQIGMNGGNIEFDITFSDVLLGLVPTVYPSLAEALSFSGPGDEVRVQGGFVSTDLHFVPGGVSLSGGWNADYTQQDPDNPTILVGKTGSTVVDFGSSSQWTEVRNLVIRNGDGKSRTIPETGTFGGGAHLYAAKVRFVDVRFEDNDAGDPVDQVARGGAVAAYDSELEFDGCSFAGNRAQEGGALYLFQSNALITGCSFEGSALFNQIPLTEKRGGAIFAVGGDLTLIDTQVTGYSLAKKGGAIYLGGGHLSLQGCVIEANSATQDGGAIWQQGGELSLTQSSLLSNSATSLGAAIYANPTLVQWQGGVAAGNISGGLAGAAYLDTELPGSLIDGVLFEDDADAFSAAALYLTGERYDLRHNVFYGNHNPGGNGAVLLGNVDGSARHNIFVENSPVAMGGTPGASFVNDHNLYWQNGAGDPLSGLVMGSGSLEMDPLFVDAVGGDFHLGAGSPAIDAGDPAAVLDFDGSLPDLGLHGGALDSGGRPAATLNVGVAPAAGGGSRVYWSIDTSGSAPVSWEIFTRPNGDSGAGSYLGSSVSAEFLDGAEPGVSEYRVQAIDAQGHAGGWSAWASQPATAVSPAPRRFAVGQPYPNPFNPSTRLRFTLGRSSRVQAEIFDVQGRRVRGLSDREYAAGEHELHWDGRDDLGSVAASGVYFLRLRSDEGEAGRRLLLLK